MIYLAVNSQRQVTVQGMSVRHTAHRHRNAQVPQNKSAKFGSSNTSKRSVGVVLQWTLLVVISSCSEARPGLFCILSPSDSCHVPLQLQRYANDLSTYLLYFYKTLPQLTHW